MSASRSPLPSYELPAVNGLVRLNPPASVRALGGEGVPARVEDVVPARGGHPVRFRVTAPGYPGDLVDDRLRTDGIPLSGVVSGALPELSGEEDPDDEPGAASRWTMSWVTEHSRWEVPVDRAPADGDGPRAWWVSPAGPVRRRQQRRFFRLDLADVVTVEQLGPPFECFDGRIIDLGEGGVRVLLPGAGLEAGMRVVARLAVDGWTGDLAGTVLRSRRPSRSARAAGWHREVVILFDDPDRYSQDLRRALARAQIRTARLAPPPTP